MENTHHKSPSLHKMFLVLASVLVLGFGFAFGVGQQVLRMGANDPQTEIIESFYETLTQGQDPSLFGSIPPVDMQKGLTPFVNIYDADGKFVAGNGKLGENSPAPLKGVFDFAKKNGENRFTWQPQKGVRIAAVLRSYKTGVKQGFILAGKSLKEVENRIQNLMKMSAVSLIVALLVLWLVINAVHMKKKELEMELKA